MVRSAHRQSVNPPRLPLQLQNFWLETVHRDPPVRQEPLPSKVDVAIMGGGNTGLSAARSFAMGGARVIVLEAMSMGWGASSRNGGMVLTGLQTSMESVRDRHGPDVARRLFACSLESIRTVEEIIRAEKISCGFTRSGHVLLASKPGHVAAFAREAEYMAAELGHNVELIPASELNSEIGSRHFYGGLRDRVSAGLNPAQYVQGLALAAERAGAGLHANTRVLSVKRKGHGFSVSTTRGTVAAERVLAATAGLTGSATRKLQRRIIPIGSFIVATEQLPAGLCNELIPQGRMLFDSRHFLSYFRRWDDRLIFGGRAAFFPETSSTVRQSAEILRRKMTHVFPQLEQVAIEYAWGGTLDFSFDRMTHVGEDDGILYSLGYAGHGVAMATYLGKTLAEAVLAGTLQEHPFASVPLPRAPLGLYGGWPWFLPLVGAYVKVLDWIQ